MSHVVDKKWLITHELIPFRFGGYLFYACFQFAF